MQLLWLTAVLALQCCAAAASRSIIYGDDSSQDGSTEDSSITSSFVLPKQIFNDGKPFYLEKDPVSGTLDFNLKKSAQAQAITSGNELSPQTDKDISLSTNSVKAPNFHDFLNLPVKYSSSKFVYPLVSSSYANLKYQGNNKNYFSNHKNATVASTSTTTPPRYYTSPRDELYKSTRASSSTTLRTIAKIGTPAAAISTTTTTSERPTSQTSTTVRRRPSYSQSTSSTRPTLSSRYTTNEQSRYPSRGTRPTTSTTTHMPIANQPFSSTTTRRYQTIPSRTAAPSENSPNILRGSTEKSRPSAYQPTTPNTTYVGSNEFRPFTPLQNFVTRPPVETATKKNHTESSGDMNLSDLFNSLFSDDEDYDTTTSAPVRVETTTERRNSPTPAVRINETVPNLSLRVTRPQFQVQSSTSVVPSATPSSTTVITSPSVPSSLPPSPPSSRPTHHSRRPTAAPTLVHPTHVQHNQQHYRAPQQPLQPSQQPPPQQQPKPMPNTQNFVTFDVPPPQNNVLQFKPVSSMNNIVISPDQDSAAFVLGSQQAVGSGENIQPFGNKMVLSSDQHSFAHPIKLSDKDHYEVDDFSQINFSTMKPKGFAHASTTESIKATTLEANNVIAGAGGLSSSVRFPIDNFDNAPIVKGTFKADQKPVLTDSLALAQQGVPQHVAFPQSSGGPMRENHVYSSFQVTNNLPQQPQPQQLQPQQSQQPQQHQQHQHHQHPHANGAAPPSDKFNLVSFTPDRVNGQSPQSQALSPQQQLPPHQQHAHLLHVPQQHGLPQQQNLIGGSHAPTPIRIPEITNELNQPPNDLNNRNQFRPDQMRPDMMFTGFPRPPMHAQPPHQRPPTNGGLPNILPQFRPNNQKMNIPKENLPFRMTNSRPPFIQTPNGIRYRPPVHFRSNYPTKSSGLTTIDPNIGNQVDNNRRYYQVRPAPEKIYDRALPPPGGAYHKRPFEKAPFMQQPPLSQLPQLPQQHALVADREFTERKYAIANDLEQNFATHGPVDHKPPVKNEKVSVIEPVVTLQMIQQQKMYKKTVHSSAPQPTKEAIDELPAALLPSQNTPPVYVVYPMQKNAGQPQSIDDRETVIVGKRGSQKPVEITTGTEYQNTPFTVIRQEQKPILSAKPKQSPHQKQVFPYALERVKENYANGVYNLGEEPTDAIPRVINKGAQLFADVYNDKQIVNK